MVISEIGNFNALYSKLQLIEKCIDLLLLLLSLILLNFAVLGFYKQHCHI